MCIAIRHQHSACGHDRKIEVIDPCSQYDAEDEACCGPNILARKGTEIIHTVSITQPAQCPDCFRETVQEIDKRHDDQIKCYNHELGDIAFKFEHDFMQALAKEQLICRRAFLLMCIDQVNEMRKREIQGFREEQGVWAEG